MEIELKELNIIDNGNVLPIEQDANIAAFAIIVDDNLDTPASFFNFLAQSFTGDIDFGFIDESLNDNDADALQSGITKAEIVIFLLLSKKDIQIIEPNMIKNIEQFTENKLSIFVTNQKFEQYYDLFSTVVRIPNIETDSLASAIIKISGKSIDN